MRFEEAKKLTLRMPAELHNELELIAKRKGVPMKCVIVFALWECLR